MTVKDVMQTLVQLERKLKNNDDSNDKKGGGHDSISTVSPRKQDIYLVGGGGRYQFIYIVFTQKITLDVK